MTTKTATVFKEPDQQPISSERFYSVPQVVARVGFWSAILSAILAIGWASTFALGIIISPPQEWTGIEAYVPSFNFITMVNLIPSLPLAAAFIVLMVSIHYYAPEDKKIWSMLGLAFTIVYAVMASINYLIQLIVVWPSILSAETEGLGLFVGTNPHSIFWALATSYAYMSLGMLFAAWVFVGEGLERWIRWLFVAVGITAPFQLVISLLGSDLVMAIPVILVWVVGVPLSCVLLAVLFRRIQDMQPPNRRRKESSMNKQIPLSQSPVSAAYTAHPLVRWLWLSLGVLLVGLGSLGIVLPVLPTTVFFIGAAACFTRSSPRLERWVLALPRIGSLVRDYRTGLGMPRRAKYLAVGAIVVAITLSSLTLPSWLARTAAYGLAVFAVWYVLLRVPTRERVLAERVS
jgi:uncharacterized protein